MAALTPSIRPTPTDVAKFSEAFSKTQERRSTLVHVRGYHRTREGRREDVDAHDRRAPARGDNAPARPQTPRANAPAPRPTTNTPPESERRRTNDAARRIIIEHEGDTRQTLRLHQPRGAANSGVTLGYGYDMGARSAEQIFGDMTAIGIGPNVARQISAASGLRGEAARRFIDANANLLVLSLSQREQLLDRILPYYERQVARAITVPLNDNQFSALVAFTYQAGEGELRNLGVAGNINSGSFEAALRNMRFIRIITGGEPRLSILRRRLQEADLFRQP